MLMGSSFRQMKQLRRTGPTLPPELLERVKDEGQVSSKHKQSLSRKDARKQERQAKRQRKATHLSVKRHLNKEIATEASVSPAATPTKRAAPGVRAGESATKKRRISRSEILASPSNGSPKSPRTPRQSPPDAPAKNKPGKSNKRPAPTIHDILPSTSPTTEAQEDMEIARLESLLGLPKKRATHSLAPLYGTEFAEDGLDDLLMNADQILAGTLSTCAENAAEDAPSAQGGVASSAHSSDEKNTETDLGNENARDVTHANDITSDTCLRAEPPAPENNSETSMSRYVPPHLRRSNTGTEGVTENTKLRRQIKGLLNRMSEQNIENILGEFLALYRRNPRYEVTTNITSQVLDGISSHSSLLDAYVILHGTLIASLHKLIGIDFAAHFVETCVSTYETYRKHELANSPLGVAADRNDDFTPGKECMNLILLISELYNVHVISCVLVYDLIRDLLAGGVTELNIELLLKITRNSGPQLRHDDPLALRDIVQLVQTKLGDKNARELGSRVRFMLETLTNLKNNKVKQPVAQAQGADSVTRLRKFLNGLSKKHHVLAHEPLNVSLVDLQAADKKGKWWLIGSAWTGDPLGDAKHPSTTKSYSVSTAEEALLKLARKQGMNTEIRRSIFVVLMSSDDYIDACERLGHLGLSEVQRREIGRVVIHCCGNEKAYNPYYTMIGQHLCRASHSFQITLQYCLWDFLREIGEDEVGGTTTIANLTAAGAAADKKAMSSSKIRNVAHAYGWWAAKGSVSLSILKAVPLESLKAGGEEFFKAFFAQVFIGSQTTAPLHSYWTLPPKGVLPFGRDVKLLEPLFFKTVVQQTAMATGMYRFLSKTQWNQVTKSASTAEFLNWASEKVKEIIREGLDL